MIKIIKLCKKETSGFLNFNIFFLKGRNTFTLMIGTFKGSKGSNPISGIPLGISSNNFCTAFVEQLTKSGFFI